MSEPTQQQPSMKVILYAAGAVLLLLVAMWAWKLLAVRGVTKSAEAERAELVAQHETREAKLRLSSFERLTETLKLIAVPLAWAVRTEAIQEDYVQIEEYLARLVKEPAVTRAVLVSPDGDIRITTDKKLQAEPASRFFGDLTAGDGIALEQEGDELRLMVPILGYDTRLGSLIIGFSRRALMPTSD